MRAFKSRFDFERFYGLFMFLLCVALVFSLVGVFAAQEAQFKREQAAIKQHYVDHPDEKRLVFNCVNPKTYVIDCTKPWLKKDS